MEPPEGAYIVYSAGTGQAALDRLSDDDPDPNSVFTRALLPRITERGVSLRVAMNSVRTEVRQTARTVGHAQFPAVYDQLDGDFYFVPAAMPAPEARPQSAPGLDACAAARHDWSLIAEAGVARALEHFILAHGDCPMLTALAEAQLAALQPAPAGRPPLSAAETAAMERRLAELESLLSTEEAARLEAFAAAEALRARLAQAEAELSDLSLALEEKQARAEETLAGEEARSQEDPRRLARLQEEVMQLSSQVGNLQSLLDDAAAREEASEVQIQALGSELNAALARVAFEERRRAELEEAERRRLEEEAQRLAANGSEFFGRLVEVLEGREGVQVEGDRLVFSSEVLFSPGRADLSPEGQAQIAGVVALLREVSDEIPDGIDWILRVDGHTDDVPLGGGGEFADNWALSQGRALSVVRFMTEELGFPPQRLAAAGFGEYRPVATNDTEAGRARNRRIELKLTEQ